MGVHPPSKQFNYQLRTESPGTGSLNLNENRRNPSRARYVAPFYGADRALPVMTILAAIPLNLLMISMSKPRNYCLTAYLLDRPFWGTTQEPDRSAEEVTRHKYSQHDIIIQCALFVKQVCQMESHRSVHYIQPKP